MVPFDPSLCRCGTCTLESSSEVSFEGTYAEKFVLLFALRQ